MFIKVSKLSIWVILVASYLSNKENEAESKIPLFRFPLDSVQCQKWIKAIP